MSCLLLSVSFLMLTCKWR